MSALRLLCAVGAVCTAAGVVMAEQGASVDPFREIAIRYVKLVLAVGPHDADFVDAYYGGEELRKEAEAAKAPLATLAAQAAALESDIAKAALPGWKDDAELWRLRKQYLQRQTAAVGARIGMLQGKKLSFDEESRALYDAVAPTHTEAEFAAIISKLDARLPGAGSIIARYDAFKADFVIPKERLDTVFQAAIRACRDRTRQYVELPTAESFTVEYVTGKSWSGYNWYQGNFRSLIQVNTDLPIYIDRAIDLACHEGYPGHHVYNVLLEKHLVRDRGWPEFTVYALFSPQSLIAEGTANYGIDVAFTRDERIAFERDVLFPMANISASRAQEYYDVMEFVDQLSYAGNEAARRYLNGQIDATAAADWLEKYAMMPRARAEQRVKFFDQYRSYVINYNLGKDLVKAFVERRVGNDRSPRRKWDEFAQLLSSPRLPSSLR
ncbi:MAG TPA: hypothetical protein VMO26_24630 [Vicinamibacterales bacterium]|nr:hypothetical protein [Vicinamibacterales bacterium]